MRTIAILFSFLIHSIVIGQNQYNIFSFEDFLNNVRTNHPLVKQADLELAKGDAEVLQAKGSFDPNIQSSFSQKQFKEDPYYRILSTDLNIPTPWGMDVSTGYERTSGVFLNPENSDPDNGLFYAGVSIPLGRGLLIDSRRAQLQKARIFLKASEIERQLMVNDLLLDASNAYLEWWKNYQVFQIVDSVVQVTLIRHQSIVASALIGDISIIDTTESVIQLQNLRLSRNLSLIEYLNATISLSAFLWDNDGRPVLLSDQMIPEPLLYINGDFEFLENSVDNLMIQHPELQSYDFKLETIDVEVRLAKEYLKPKASLKYQLIADGGNNPLSNISTSNHTLGVSFSMPLLFRSERGKLQKFNIKRQQITYDRISKEAMIRAKLSNALNMWRLHYEQYAQYQNVIQNYEALMQAEEVLFQEGESSLFLINSRQKSLIDANIKLINLLTKTKSAEIKTYYNMGAITRIPM